MVAIVFTVLIVNTEQSTGAVVDSIPTLSTAEVKPLKVNLKQIETLAIAETTEIEIVEPVIQPTQPASSGSDIELIVRQAARKYGIDENYFVGIANCESTLNPNAVNTNYFENGHPSGIFQHLSGYWPARAAQYGYAGASVFDAVANANVTAAMFAEGHSNLWEC